MHVAALEVVELIVGNDGRLIGPDRLDDLELQSLFLGQELRIAAEQDVGTAARHVGGDGDSAEPAGLGNDVSFLLMVLCVQHVVPDAHAS
ncbi:MAG: hypothetical protein QM757_39915 [Paludibaculum sp.]